jgi:hypothetical protein
MSRKFTSIETKHYEERQALFDALPTLNRRDFLKVSAAAMAARPLEACASIRRRSSRSRSRTPRQGRALHFAYISDSHLYRKT